MSDPLSIGNEMTQFDRKNRAFYDSLTDDEKKKFSPYIMIRWGSLVGGGADLQAYYVMSCNERLNKHFFDINTTQHKKLQWLLATTVSPGMGTHRHQWLALPKKGGSGGNKSVKFLRTLFPAMKDDEIKLLASLNDKDDLKALARAHGMADKDIKDLL
jgi:hypothetical protein